MDKSQKKQKYEEIKNDIITNNSFSIHHGMCADVDYGTDYFSEGIRRMCLEDQEFCDLTSQLAKRFYNDDYGTMYGYDERPTPFKEQGYYETDYGVIGIKRDVFITTMYMQFER